MILPRESDAERPFFEHPAELLFTVAQCLIQPIRVIRLYCFDACASKAEFGQYWLRELNCLFQPGNVVSRFCPSE